LLSHLIVDLKLLLLLYRLEIWNAGIVLMEVGLKLGEKERIVDPTGNSEAQIRYLTKNSTKKTCTSLIKAVKRVAENPQLSNPKPDPRKLQKPTTNVPREGTENFRLLRRDEIFAKGDVILHNSILLKIFRMPVFIL